VRDFIKDPFFHFFITASLIYALQSIPKNDEDKMLQIKIRKSEIAALKTDWKKDYENEPTKEELKCLIHDLSVNKMLFNEALAMGLHKEDKEIFNKLVKKAKFLFSNIKTENEPTKMALLRYYEDHKNDYRKDANISFTHVFISIDRKNPIQKANRIFRLLENNRIDPYKTDAFTDRFEPRHIKNKDKEQIIKLFSKSFYKQIMSLKAKRWNKPIISSKGIHIVYIESFSGIKTLPYDVVKDIVKSDYAEDMRIESLKSKIETLKKRYKIVYEDHDK